MTTLTGLVILLVLGGCGPKQPPAERFLNYYQTGQQFMQNKKYKKAIHYFQKAMDIESRNPEIYRRIAICFEKLNQPDSAVLYYEGTIVYDPKDSDAYQCIGDIFYEQGDMHEAKTWYDRAMELGQIKPQSYARLGTMFYKWRDYDQALRYYSIAVLTDSTYMDGFYGLGLAELAKGDTAKAITDFERTAAIGKLPNAFYKLGLIYYNRHDFDKASDNFNAYLKCAPNGPYAAEAGQYQLMIQLGEKGENNNH